MIIVAVMLLTGGFGNWFGSPLVYISGATAGPVEPGHSQHQQPGSQGYPQNIGFQGL